MHKSHHFSVYAHLSSCSIKISSMWSEHDLIQYFVYRNSKFSHKTAAILQKSVVKYQELD